MKKPISFGVVLFNIFTIALFIKLINFFVTLLPINNILPIKSKISLNKSIIVSEPLFAFTTAK